MKYLIFIFVISLLITSISSASEGLPVSIKGTPCFKFLGPKMKSVDRTASWKKVLSPNSVEVYRAPTPRFGHWVQIALKKNSELSVSYFSPNKIRTSSYTSKCKAKITTTKNSIIDLKQVQKKGSNYFTDKDLKKEISVGKGLIYVWSPQFVYSLKFLNQVKEIAKTLKIKFKPIMTYDTDLRWLASDSVRNNLPPNSVRHASTELLMRNSDLHSPTIFIYKNGKIVHDNIVGVYEPSTLKNVLKKALSK